MKKLRKAYLKLLICPPIFTIHSPDLPFGASVTVRRRQKKTHKRTKENQPDITDIEKAFVDQGSEHVREEMY